MDPDRSFDFFILGFLFTGLHISDPCVNFVNLVIHLQNVLGVFISLDLGWGSLEG